MMNTDKIPQTSLSTRRSRSDRPRGSVIAAATLGMILLIGVAFFLDELHDRTTPGAPPSGERLPSHPVSLGEARKLESGEQSPLHGAVFANQRVHLDLTLAPGSVCDLYFHDREREAQDVVHFGAVGTAARARHTVRLSANDDVATGFVVNAARNLAEEVIRLEPGAPTAVAIQSRYGVHTISIGGVEIARLEDGDTQWGKTGITCVSGGAVVHSLTVVPLATAIQGPLSIERVVWRSALLGGLAAGWLVAVVLLGRGESVGRAVKAAVAATATLAGAGLAGTFVQSGAAWVEIAFVAAGMLLAAHCFFERERLRLARFALGLHAFVVLVAAEGAMRAAGSNNKTTSPADWVTTESPTVLWELVPGSGVGDRYINAHGCRGEELDAIVESDGYRIVCVGGSSCFGEAIEAIGATYPASLEALLARNDGTAFEVVNAGVPGYSSYQMLRRLRSDLTRLAPDVVVVSHAYEDGNRALFLPDRELSASYQKRESSRLYGLMRRLNRSSLWRSIAGRAEVGASASIVDSSAVRVSVDRFESNLLALDALADSLQFELLYVLEAQHDFHSPDPERAPYHSATRSVARQTGRALVDMLAVFRRHRHDLLFRGAVQQSERGASLMAEAVYESLRQDVVALSGLAPLARLGHRKTTAAYVTTPIRARDQPSPTRDPNRRRLDLFADVCIELGRALPSEEKLRLRLDDGLLGEIDLPELGLEPAGFLLARAGSALARNDRFAAIEALRNAVAIAPMLAVAQNLLASELIASAEFGEARTVIDAGIAAAPGSVPLHLQRARLALRQGKAREALRAADAAVALDSSSGEALFLSGVARLRAGDSKGATEQLERLLEVAPNSTEAVRARGLLGREG